MINSNANKTGPKLPGSRRSCHAADDARVPTLFSTPVFDRIGADLEKAMRNRVGRAARGGGALLD
jgi:hypothetical protein